MIEGQHHWYQYCWCLYKIVFSHNSLTFSDSLQVLKSLLMSGGVESGVLDEGDSAGVPQDSFENHFRDMFLNMTHYIHMHACTQF